MAAPWPLEDLVHVPGETLSGATRRASRHRSRYTCRQSVRVRFPEPRLLSTWKPPTVKTFAGRAGQSSLTLRNIRNNYVARGFFDPAGYRRARPFQIRQDNRMLTYLLIGINVLVSLIGFSKMNSGGDSMFFFSP